MFNAQNVAQLHMKRWIVCCSSSPTLHNEVKDLYIAAVKAVAQDVDADIQVGFWLLHHYVLLMLVTIN